MAAALRLLRRRTPTLIQPLLPASSSSPLRASTAAAANNLPASPRLSPPSLLRLYSTKDKQLGDTVPNTESYYKRFFKDKEAIIDDLYDSGQSLEDAVENLKERTEVLDKALHDFNKAIVGKGLSLDLVEAQTGIRKEVEELCEDVRQHLKLQNSVDEQFVGVFVNRMERWVRDFESLKMGGIAGATLALGGCILLMIGVTK